MLHKKNPFRRKRTTPPHVHRITPPWLSSILHNDCRQPFWIRDIDRLDVAVELFFCAFLVVTFSRDADAETEGDAFDAGFPDFLVELGVEAYVLGALW